MPSQFSALAGDYFKALTANAQRLVAAEAAGASTDLFDFSCTTSCWECGNLTKEVSDPLPQPPSLSCGTRRRKFVLPAKQRSTALKKTAWKIPKIPGAQTHKQLCADNKRHMLRLPEFTALLLQFPWGRVEKDGTFSVEIARGRFNVLGAAGFGYWSHRGGPMAHLSTGSVPEEIMLKQGTKGKMIQQIAGVFDYLDGTALLETSHATDCDGWKLNPELIPFLKFSSLWVPPRLSTKMEIRDWASWYAWRRIPMESPAALLLDFPLSIYWLLVDTLRVADPKAGSPDRARIQLSIQYIGAEVELNFLPLFGELALLLPYTDIKMICFGKAVHTLVSGAKNLQPKSLAAQTSSTHPIYSYTAPEESGAGRIEIYLHGTATHWTPADADATLSPYGRPDALVAPNAGLGSYPAWYPVILYAHHTGIPFGVTEYTEQSCEFQLTLFPKLLHAEAVQPGSITGHVPGVPGAEAARTAAAKHWEYRIELNPFQRPGQRAVSTKVPNVPNGFTIKVVGK
ncbi:hypothetical protein C8R47DRAFT_1071350 [Mycena vitilis]|nr:hypothetical protein C8R47DRAFT_1071350 [Mycena vitilis]